MPDSVEGTADSGTSNPLVKLMVGTFAGLIAVFFPQLVVYLKYAGSQSIKFPEPIYITVGFLFAVVIGAITLIFEHRVRRTLGQTFMAALGIPAVLSGAIGAAGLAENGLAARQTATENFQKAAKDVGIPIEQPIGLPPSGQSPRGGLFELTTSAYAAEDTDVAVGSVSLLAQASYVPQFVAPRYLVVLERMSDQGRADSKAKELQQRGVRDATVRQAGSEFLVVAGEPLAEAEALSRATQIKRDGIANPSLAPVQTK